MKVRHALLCFTCIALGASPLFDTAPVQAQEVRPPSPTQYNPARSLAPLVERLSPAVVNLSVTTGPQVKDPKVAEYMRRFGLAPRQEESQGSGFLISSDGYILTNHHVIENATEIVVRMSDEEEYQARVIGSDPRIDVGLVKIDHSNAFPYVRLGESDG